MSQAGILDVENSNPQIPTSFTTDNGTAIPIANNLEILGGEGIDTSGSGKTVTISGEDATAGVNVGAANKGIAAFDSAMFTVTNGFVQLSSGGLGIDEILTDSGAPSVKPDGTGLVNIIGGTGIDVTGQGPGNTVTISSTATFTDLHAARFIVSAGGSTDGANYTTIASAYAAAVAAGGRQTVFVQPGTYTENLTLSNGVNICAFNCDANSPYSGTPNVIIAGTLTATFSGSCSLSGLCLRTNSATDLTVSGANATNVYLSQCYIDATNNNAIALSSSGGSNIVMFQCNGNIGTTGIHYFDVSGAGSQLLIYGGWYANTGGSTSVSTISSSGKIYARYVEMYNAFTTSNTASTNIEECLIRNPGNVGVTINGTGENLWHYNRIESGTASALSVGAGASVQSDYLSLDSSNANVITGAGALSYGAVVFTGSSSGVNITTYTPYTKSFIDKANASTGVILRSNGTNFVASTSTYPNTNAVNTLLYASSANVMAALATANSGVLTTDSSGVPSIDTTNFVRQTTGMQMKGNNTNTAPPAGFIGERITSTATAVALVDNTAKTVTSIALTAGIWDLTGIVQFSNTTFEAKNLIVSISTTNNTHEGTQGDQQLVFSTTCSGFGASIPNFRVLTSGTPTYYLVATSDFATGSCTANGRLSAVRVG